jgi:hypothetical protein
MVIMTSPEADPNPVKFWCPRNFREIYLVLLLEEIEYRTSDLRLASDAGPFDPISHDGYLNIYDDAGEYICYWHVRTPSSDNYYASICAAAKRYISYRPPANSAGASAWDVICSRLSSHDLRKLEAGTPEEKILKELQRISEVSGEEVRIPIPKTVDERLPRLIEHLQSENHNLKVIMEILAAETLRKFEEATNRNRKPDPAIRNRNAEACELKKKHSYGEIALMMSYPGSPWYKDGESEVPRNTMEGRIKKAISDYRKGMVEDAEGASTES